MIYRHQDIIERMIRYKEQFANENGKEPDVIYLDELERVELAAHLNLPNLQGIREVMKLEIRKQEEFINYQALFEVKHKATGQICNAYQETKDGFLMYRRSPLVGGEHFEVLKKLYWERVE